MPTIRIPYDDIKIIIRFTTVREILTYLINPIVILDDYGLRLWATII
jgi:hypothetical protein